MSVIPELATPTPRVLLGGRKLGNKLVDALGRVTVEQQRNLPAMCEVEFIDQSGELLKESFEPGKSLKVEVTPQVFPSVGITTPTTIFEGTVVAVEAVFEGVGRARFVLRAYDQSHRLHGERRSEAYLGQRDSDIASKIAKRCGLKASVDATSVKHDVLLQQNMTDFEFLQERARLIGYEVAVDGGVLLFKKRGKTATSGTETLTLGLELQRFRVRATAAAQSRTTTVRAYDAETKKAVVATEKPPKPESALGGRLPRAAEKESGKADVHVSVPVYTTKTANVKATAKALAQATANQAAGAVVEAEGVALGTPTLRPGGKVKIKDVGDSFSGTYQLSSVRHVIDYDGYETEFTVSGLNDRSLLGLTAGTGPGELERRRGMPVVGVVSNVKDPDELGRVKVKYPWLDDKVESDWARVVSPGAGKQRGLMLVPEMDDVVVVVFEQGDPQAPLVIGGIWGSTDKPPTTMNVEKEIPTRMLKSRLGHELTMQDGAKEESVLLSTAKGTRILIEDKPKERIVISDGKGNNSIEVDLKSSNIDIKCKGALSLSAVKGIKIDTKGTFEVSAVGGVKVDSKATLELSGISAKVAGKTMLDLEGLTANLKGTTQTTVKGALVMIN